MDLALRITAVHMDGDLATFWNQAAQIQSRELRQDTHMLARNTHLSFSLIQDHPLIRWEVKMFSAEGKDLHKTT